MRWLSDEAVVGRLDALANQERKLGAEIVAHLAEVERRKLHLAMGYGSMFAYATERLKFSEQAAYRRIRAARLSQEHPQVLEYLAKGEVTLSSLNALGNSPCAELLEEARGKSKREVEALAAAASSDYSREESKVPITERGLALLQEAKDLDPSSAAELVEKALSLFVAQKRKQRFAQVEKPRQCSADKTTTEKKISAATKRTVYERDGASCSFVGKDGRRCGSTHLLEFDHRKPRALGGKDEPANIRLLCRAHNQYEAERVFGEEKLESQRQQTALRRDAHSALTNLGFAKKEAASALDQVMPSHQALEPLLRAALQALRPQT
jgi:hypothetical protein